MKQKNKIKIVFFLAIVLLCLPTYAQTSADTGGSPGTLGEKIPEAGIKAEMQGQWEKALIIYRQTLLQEPARADLWLRIADIEAHLQNKEKVAAALTRATQLHPKDPGIFFKLSQAHAQLNRPGEAFAAIERAVALDPDNIEYLKARARLANWIGKPKIAADSYHRLIKLLPGDDQLQLYLARAEAWSGKLDRSAGHYRKFMSLHPQRLDVLNEYIKVQTWRGNYAGAFKLVEQYRKKGGDQRIYQMRKADILSRAPRPRAGLKTLAPLLEEDPGNYELNTARTIALHYDHRPVEAVDSLETLERLRPQSLENRDIRRFVWTPLRHAFPAGAQYYSDSIDISILSVYLDAGIRLNRRIRLQGGYSSNLLRAPVESAFNNINGKEEAFHSRQWVGGNFRVNPVLALEGFLGIEQAEELPTTTTYGVDAHLQLSDGFKMGMGRNYGYYLISPRAVSLGIKMASNHVDLQWNPGLRYTVALYGWYDTFTDDNTRWQVIAAPRAIFKRTSRLNLDIGAKGWWFGFKNSPNTGYWSPSFFQSYMGVVYGYWKLSENHGIDFRAEAGVLKASTMDRFRFGYSLDAEGIFGIFGDLLLKIRAGYLHNMFRANGAFSAYLFSASLMLRL